MKTYASIIAFIAISISLHAQPFERIFTMGNATSILQREDSTYLLSISQLNHGILSLQQSGDSVEYDSFPYCTINSIIKSLDGGYLMTGGNIQSTEICLIKLDSDLDTIWMRNFPSDGFNGAGIELVEQPDSSITVSTISRGGMSTYTGRIMHMDKDGILVWMTNLFDIENTNLVIACNDTMVFSAANIRHAGNRSIQIYCNDIHTGDTINKREYYDTSAAGISYAASSICLIGTDLYIAGNTSGDSSSVTLTRQMLLRTDLHCDSLWMRKHGPGSLTTVIAPNTHNVYCTANGDSIGLIHFDDNGNIIWRRNFKQFDRSTSDDLIATSDHGFAFCGQAIDTVTPTNYTYVVHTDSMGMLTSILTSIISPEATLVNCYFDQQNNFLRINAEVKNLTAFVYSVDGRLVMSKELNADVNNLNLEGLMTGKYIVSIRKQDQIISRYKFLILK